VPPITSAKPAENSEAGHARDLGDHRGQAHNWLCVAACEAAGTTLKRPESASVHATAGIRSAHAR